MLKKAMLLGTIGFVMGAMIGVIFMLAQPPADFPASLPNILIGGIWGTLAMSSSVVYDIEQWSIARATATHFLFIFAGYTVLSLGLGWFRISDGLFWIIMAGMVIAYILVWLFMYLAYKKQVRKMNEDLEKLRSAQDNE